MFRFLGTAAPRTIRAKKVAADELSRGRLSRCRDPDPPCLRNRLPGGIRPSSVAFSGFHGPPRQLERLLRLSLGTGRRPAKPENLDTENVSSTRSIARPARNQNMPGRWHTPAGVAVRDNMKGYKIDTGHLHRGVEGRTRRHRVASTATIEIDEFVPKTRYRQTISDPPYYLVPDGKVGHDAFACSQKPSRP